MSFRRNGFLHRLLLIMFAVGALEGAAYAQFSVNITGPGFTSTTAPTGQFNVSATITGNANPIVKVVFYRNDVPYQTYTSSPFQLSQNQLGQDTYTYRARAYDSAGTWVDSIDVKLTVNTYQVIRMGDPNGPVTTQLPGRLVDHTAGVKNAVAWLGSHGGGTLFFPCTFPSGESVALYNIKETIDIPSNVTLQGESAEDHGRCRIYWNDVSWNPDPVACQADPNSPLPNNPMFRVLGGKSGVRFKDLSLYSRTTGPNCPPRIDFGRIEAENIAAIELNTSSTGNITDVIVENVSITHFKHGIRAISDPSTSSEISDIKIRAYRPSGNHRQLYINAKYAYNWDVQNLNITGMMETQGAVEIVNAGKPASPVGENTKLKFLQVNCNASHSAPPAFCVRVEKHGGLYFRQLHHEGTNQALIVEDISGRPATNPDPIVFESSTGTGTFNDASMKLYLIGTNIFAAPEIAQAGLDTGRLRFIGAGVNSTVIDCGDIHWDITDTDGDPNDPPSWADLGMYYSHTERNRASFFADDSNGNKFTKTHTPCPQGVAGLPNVNEIGGEYFDSGLIPTEVGTYSHELSSVTCDSQCNPTTKLAQLLDLGGTVYVKNSFTLTSTVTVRSGSQIIGAPDVTLTLNANNTNLFLINAPVGSNALARTSGVVIRDLKLKTTGSGNTGIAIVGDAAGTGVSSDLHFSGLTIEGFENGFYVRPTIVDPAGPHPMVDGLSLKNSTFVNNQTAVRIFSGNASNWNIMNLKLNSDSANANGWDQKNGGHQSLQNITCQGSSSHPMSNCIRLSMTGTYLAGVKPASHVTNGLTVFDSMLTYFLIRDSDFRSARVNITGRSFIVSMNNKYDDFNVDWTVSDGDFWHGKNSRLTYCGDTYAGGIYSGSSNGLATTHPNLIVGVPTLTRVSCGTRPIPWDDVVRWGGEANDKPLVGNFFDNVREDFVIYRPGSQSYFLIKQAGGVGTKTIPWGQSGDIPLIGRFYPDSRAQIVIWRPSLGDFWIHDPRLFVENSTTTNYAFHWGQSGDIPFVGNFFDEYGPGGENNDEIGIYRPSDRTIWIANPRSGEYLGMGRSADYGTNIQIGDFRGVGYDQIAQYQAGVWNIIDTRTAQTYTLNLGQSGDVPVAGKYLTGACTQLGVWRPGTQEFIVADPFSSCGTRSTSMIWGSNNDNGSTQYTDDIPLTINTADGSLRRPTSYRPTKGAFEFSLSNGQWWVHDPF
jgi:hypothetical protein